MSLQKLFGFIVYLLEDEQELSLGMLDTSPTYPKFLMFHVDIMPFATCFLTLHSIFMHFLGLAY